MKTEIKIYHGLSIFFVFITIVYGCMTYFMTGSIEWVGVPALALTAGVSLMIGFYLQSTAKRIDARPEDDLDGEIHELAGEQGTFAPHSWWPLALAGACSILFLGMAIGPFVMLYGLPFLAFSIYGWVYEFYRGEHAH